MGVAHKLLRVSVAGWAILLSVVGACDTAIMYPVNAAESTEADAQDTGSDPVPGTDNESDSFLPNGDSDDLRDSDDIRCREPNQCHDEIFCRHYAWAIVGGTCDTAGMVCCEPPQQCYYPNECLPRNSLDCMTGIILRSFCSHDSICCKMDQGVDVECEAIDENTCVPDTATCFAGGGTPHGAQCGNGNVCCFQALYQ